MRQKIAVSKKHSASGTSAAPNTAQTLLLYNFHNKKFCLFYCIFIFSSAKILINNMQDL